MHHSFLNKNFTSSLTATLTHSLPTCSPCSNNHFHRFRPDIWAYLHQPSWDTTLSPAVSHNPPGFHWSPVTGPLLRLFFPEMELSFLTHCLYLVLVHRTPLASKVVISIQSVHQIYIHLFLLLDNFFFLFSFKFVLFFFLWGIYQVLNTFLEVK